TFAASAQSPPAGGAATEGNALRIDLGTALRLADERNLDIAIYLARVTEASARLARARSLGIPTLRVGAGYNRHTGNIQETGGQVIDADRVSRFVGIGAGSVGPGDLALDVDIGDAIFAPLAARQDRAAAESESDANRHAVLLDVATAYLAWLQAREESRIAAEILDRATDLATMTSSYARAGEGLEADAQLAAVQPLLWRQRRLAAEQRAEAAAAALTRLLHLDAAVRLDPMESEVPVIDLYSVDDDVNALVERALEGRPETDQLDSLVAAGEAELRAQRYGLFVPKVSLRFSSGDFGGGPGSSIADTGHRDDLTLQLYWQLDQLGFGHRALTNEKRAQLRQTELRRDKLRDAIAAEVRDDYTEAQSLRAQMQLSASAVEQAQGAYTLHRRRIFDRQGLPLEALQAMSALADAEMSALTATVGFSAAQIRLHTALGNPVDAAQIERGSSNPP
ncbi:MAG TPA: TolC family protein, partial [Gammaproteobacteria bacterium]|nr:TolC family protein [Gammaproteobacteria bacterium]